MTSGAAGPPFDVSVPGTTAKGARRGAADKLSAIVSQRALFDEAVETAKRCGSATARGAGVLLALAFVFGFSERALTTLEDTLAKPFGFTGGDQARRPPRDDDGDAGGDEAGRAGLAGDSNGPADDKKPA